MKASSEKEKQNAFEAIVKAVIAHDSRFGGEGFNFADVEWVANEAKSLGLLATPKDAELLSETIASYTQISQFVCLEEITPVLEYKSYLDTQSVNRLEDLINRMGWSSTARAIGISKPALEKLVTGGSRGPLFRHMPVSGPVIAKAKAFLTARVRG